MPDFALLERTGVEAIFLTHCHLDHIGTLPVLARQFNEAPIFMTEPTAAIGDAMLHNSVNVMSRQREELGMPDYPLYGHRETDRMVRNWQVRPYAQRFSLDGERAGRREETTFELHEAGHILGAAGVLLRHKDRSILYTGDVHFSDQTICRAARLPEKGIDTLIIETTRGDTQTPEDYTRDREIYRLADRIQEVHSRGGGVLIPVFALGKTQELLGIIHRLRKERVMREVPLYIGGLSTKVTGIIDDIRHNTPRLQPKLSLLDALRPFSVDGSQVATMPVKGGHLYTLSSGMMTEKTLSNQFVRNVLPHSEHAIFFVGYADPESPAGRIRTAVKQGGPLFLNEGDREETPLRCTIDEFDFSAHASREQILDYICRVNPATLLLVHGDPSALAWFERAVPERLPHTRVIIPQPAEPIEL